MNTKNILIGLFSFLVLTVMTTNALAETSAPQKMVYSGRLLDSSGNAVTTGHSIRFSFWHSADYVSADITGAGAIDTNAAQYAGWQEVHSVTPDQNGYFSVELGSVTALPDFSTYTNAQLQSLFLQVEVKQAAAADTSYELLDRNPNDTAIDRGQLLSNPFALNADTLDRYDTGTSSGSIPVLGSGGRLNPAMIPNELLQNSLMIDSDDSAATEVSLKFGNALNKMLSYDKVNSRFNFNDSVRIQGNLTVTGLINGVDITNIVSASGNSQLRTSSGGGLSVVVTGGSYRIGGQITDFTGSSSVMLPANTENYLFFTSTGLTVSTAFPTDKSFVPVSVVTTDGSTVTSIEDRRVQNSDDREHVVERILQPEYDGAVYKADGTDNVGQLSLGNDDSTLRNYYNWTSTRPTIQDYDVVLRVSLPDHFVRWKTGDKNPLSLQYQTTSANTADNIIDISVRDSAGNPVTLSGSVSTLANTSWTTTQIEFTGSPTWTPGGDMLVTVKLSAKENAAARIGQLKLQWVEVSSKN